MVCQIPVVGPGWGNKGHRRRKRVAIARVEKRFTYGWCSVDACYQSGTRAIAVVILQQELSGLLIQGRFGVRIDQQTLDRHEYMTDAKG